MKVDLNVLDKMIKSIHKADGSFKVKLHDCLVMCMDAMVEHKDASRLTNLVNGLSNAVNKRRGVMLWISEYSSLEYRKDKAGVRKFLGKGKEYTFIEAGRTIPFYEMAKVSEANEAFDLMKMFERLIKKAENKKDEITDATQVLLLSKLEAISKEFTPVAAKA